MTIDFPKLLDTPSFALNKLAVFDDMLSFLQFSEENVQWQKKVALQQVERERNDLALDEYLHERDTVKLAAIVGGAPCKAAALSNAGARGPGCGQCRVYN